MAKDFLLSHLTHKDMAEQQLRSKAIEKSLTDYAFHTALRELKDQKKTKAIQAKGRVIERY